MYIRSKEEYNKYLRSKHWQQIRKAFWERFPVECQACGKSGSTSDISIHHASYANLGRELWEDLVALCRDCHESLHTMVENGQAMLETAHLKLQPSADLQIERGNKFSERSLPIYVEGESYTSDELERMATAMLLRNKELGPEVLLTRDQWKRREIAEIYTGGQTPDPSNTQDRFGNYIDGMYWRTHPGGRPFCSDLQMRRTTGCGFYNPVKETNRKPVFFLKEKETPRSSLGRGICTFNGCEKPLLSSTLCSGHYQQKIKGRELRLLNSKKISDDKRIAILKHKDSGRSWAEIARSVGVNSRTVKRILEKG